MLLLPQKSQCLSNNGTEVGNRRPMGLHFSKCMLKALLMAWRKRYAEQ